MDAVIDLKDTGFLEGSIKNGALSLRVTFKGACWLLIAQPLLKLVERAVVVHISMAARSKL